MSHRERQALVGLAINLLLLGFYAAVLFAGLRPESVGWVIPAALMVVLLPGLFLADRGGKPEDERDRLIRHRAQNFFVWIVYIGVPVLVMASDGLIVPAPVNSVVLMCLVLGAAAIASATKLYLYRRI